MAVMAGLGLAYAGFIYPNTATCSVKDFITPMTYLLVASAVEITLAGLSVIPAVLDAVQGGIVAKDKNNHPSAIVGTFTILMQMLIFTLLVFLAVWAGFGGWSFWHSNQSCQPRDLYLFLWAFLIVEMALVAFRLYTTFASSVAAFIQILSGAKAKKEQVESEKADADDNKAASTNYNNDNANNFDERNLYYAETTQHSQLASEGVDYGVEQHAIVIDPPVRRY